MNAQEIAGLLDTYFDAADLIAVNWQQSGFYSYNLNGQATDVVEPWRMGVTPANQKVIESLRYSDAYNLLLKIRWLRKVDTTYCVISMKQGDSPQLVANYLINEKNWHLNLKMGGKTAIMEGEISTTTHFFPLLRIFTGDMLRNLEDGDTPLMLPDIEQHTALDNLLKPRFDIRSSKKVQGEDSLYTMQGGHYSEDNARFTVNETGVLVRYEWQQAEDKAWLIENEML